MLESPPTWQRYASAGSYKRCAYNLQFITRCNFLFFYCLLSVPQICFWLIENDLKVLVAACDTFRAGAVEQLRTHARHLNALHPAKNGIPAVQLYEKGYGKDAAGVAAEAISFAKDSKLDVVLVDTAGRMQDNEPLMRALAKVSFSKRRLLVVHHRVSCL